jgi:hypothetical protein
MHQYADSDAETRLAVARGVNANLDETALSLGSTITEEMKNDEWGLFGRARSAFESGAPLTFETEGGRISLGEASIMASHTEKANDFLSAVSDSFVESLDDASMKKCESPDQSESLLTFSAS